MGSNSAGHAALYSNGVWTDLGAFRDPDGSVLGTAAIGINNNGQIVGDVPLFTKNKKCPKNEACPPIDKSIALIFTSSGPVDLNTLILANSGFTLNEAMAINDAGQIIANATNGSGVRHAVLLTPN